MIEMEKGNVVYTAEKDSAFHKELVEKDFTEVKKKAKSKKSEDKSDEKSDEGDK